MKRRYYGSAIWFLPLMTFLLAAGSAAASGHTIVHKNEKPEPTSVHDFQNDVSNRRHWDGGRFVREWYERPWRVPDSDGRFLLADDDASQDRPPEGLLDRKEAEALLREGLSSGTDPNLKIGKIEDRGTHFEAEIVTEGDGSLVDRVTINKATGRIRPAP